MSERKVRIDMVVTLDGNPEPILTVMHRIPWPEEETLEVLSERLMRDACRELHAPKKQWKLA